MASTRGWNANHPLKAIADPKNLESPNPAIKKAAEIKAEEDLAPQKVKAIKYLARTGCGCYPGVKDALTAALDDCTEEVRFQAAISILDAANNHCEKCKGNKNCCCDEDLVCKLSKVAEEKDDKGRWLESSEPVREAAKDAKNACCSNMPPSSAPAPVTPPPVPKPEGDGSPAPLRPEGSNLPVPPLPDEVSPKRPTDGREAKVAPDSNGAIQPASVLIAAGDAAVDDKDTSKRGIADKQASNAPGGCCGKKTKSPLMNVCGNVTRIHSDAGRADIMLSRPVRLPIGTRLKVTHSYLLTDTNIRATGSCGQPHRHRLRPPCGEIDARTCGGRRQARSG